MPYNLSQATEKISKYIGLYKDLLQGKTEKKYNELYKWRNTKVFRDHWNIDAQNIALMLEESFTPASNITIGQNYYPVKMLRLFSEMNGEKVRAMFKYLMDDSKNIIERVANTEKICDELLDEYNKKENHDYLRHYIGDRFISTMLFFLFPEKYYLYKFSMFKGFCKTFSLFIPKRGGNDNLILFYELSAQVREMISKDEELIKLNRSMLTRDCYEDPSLHLLTQDFVYACTTYLSEEIKVTETDDEEEAENLSEPKMPYNKKENTRYWLLAPGTSAVYWDEFYSKGFAAISWEKMGDLRSYPNRDALADKLRKVYPENKGNNRHNSLALWNFSRDMKEGDIIIAKKGISDYLGYGIVTGDYVYNTTAAYNSHQRKVNWIKKGVWPETAHPIVTKTLTDITKYPGYLARIKKLLGIEQSEEAKTNVQHWWLNANPKYWKITDFEIGQEQSYTTYNEKGNKRRIYEYFKEIKPGDLIIGYESSPTMKVVSMMEATKSVHVDDDDGQEKVSFELRQFFSNPVSWSDLSDIVELENCDVLKNNQGSLFKLKPSEYEAIVKASSGTEIEPSVQYEMDDALNEVFLNELELTRILRLLERKKNILLQGPPGVGKTFLAKRIAHLWMESKDNDKIETVQFHQSYSYEDFMQGYRPTEDGHFKLLNGIFYRFCKKALRNPQEDYFFIIDEINRGNLSKIFGELMMLMESDKHGEEFSIPLIYSPDNISRFYIPKNLYIIGTMNTADRSLAIVDYALRRRFAFFDLKPSFGKNFGDYLKDNKVPDIIIKRIIDRITYVNAIIGDDRNLGNGFLIGHSYFCHPPVGDDYEKWYSDIIDFEIAPILKEYWFDDQIKAEDQIQRLY